MDKNLFQDESPTQRLQLLKDNAYSVDSGYSYTKDFEEEELIAINDEFTQDSIKKSAIESEKKEVMDEFKEKLKPLSKRIDENLGFLKFKKRVVSETVYLIDDQAEQTMSIYNADGILLQERPLTKAERQTVLKINKTGTNDK